MMYMDESVLNTAPVHYLLMYTQFSTHFDTSDTIVKITTLILQRGWNTTIGALVAEL
jgi:hypothetical protein